MDVQAALLAPSLSYLVQEVNNSPENKSREDGLAADQMEIYILGIFLYIHNPLSTKKKLFW